MLNCVNIEVITKENNPFVHYLAKTTHEYYNAEVYCFKDGVSVKVGNKYFKAAFYPRVYV